MGVARRERLVRYLFYVILFIQNLFRIVKGYGHCGIGAYIAVAQCEKCSIFGGCKEPQPTVNLSPPTNLPEEEVFLGQTTFLSAPIAAQGLLTSSAPSGLPASQCPARRPCRTWPLSQGILQQARPSQVPSRTRCTNTNTACIRPDFTETRKRPL